jgi:hypothetical protein
LALAVPLSRFTSRVGGGSAFYVRPRELLRFVVSQIGRRRFSAVRILVSLAQTFLDGARLALICRRRASAAACRKFGGDYLRTFL